MIKNLSIFFITFLFAFDVCADVGDDFCKLYEEMPKVYIREISVKEIAEKILSNLNELDAKIKVGGKSDSLTLYYKGKSWSFLKPVDDNDANAWCDLSKKVIAKAEEFSEKFYFADFELSEKVLSKALPLFDKDSKYFGDGLNDANKRLKNKRLFVARDVGNEEIYIKIGVFNNSTIENLNKVANDYASVSKIVVDLRGNSGGALETAIMAADLFLDEGIIVSTKNHRDEVENFYNADEKEIFSGAEMKILVDEKTASAAEMFAQALFDQGRAEIEGEETYGKNTLQNLIELPSGGVAAVTEAYFRSPSEI